MGGYDFTLKNGRAPADVPSDGRQLQINVGQTPVHVTTTTLVRDAARRVEN